MKYCGNKHVIEYDKHKIGLLGVFVTLKFSMTLCRTKYCYQRLCQSPPAFLLPKVKDKVSAV